MIEFILNEHIDFKKWDRCIRKAFNGNIYAYSWYLNIVSEKWNALIENDYERVMPLPVSRIGRRSAVVHPRLAGQLGIFSTTTLNEKTINSFLSAIPSRYRYVNLELNKHNKIESDFKLWDKRVNLDIDLIKPYPKLWEIYPPALKALLDSGYEQNFKVKTKVPIDLLTKLQMQKSPLRAYLHPGEFITMQVLMNAAIDNEMGQTCGLYENNDHLLALGFFVWSHQKATLIFHLFNNRKKQLAALFFLIDDFIRNNSEKNLILHVEMSADSKLITLLEKIGAKKSVSFYCYRNQLPWYLKPFVA